MIKKTKRLITILLLNLILFQLSFAQEANSNHPLSNLLQILQSQFQVEFNYAEDVIKDITIKAPSKDLSLDAILAYLESETHLTFKRIDNNRILILVKPDHFETQQMSEILISAYLVKGINKLNDGSFEIKVSDFDILPGLIDTDVLHAVQAFPGIQSSNETVSNLNIRGGTHDQNLILWDDIKMYQSGHFFGLISMFNPHITQHVSLIKNGTNTEYTDGVSGIISMETDRTISKDFKANLGVNFIDANGFADIPLSNNSSLQIAARKSISDFTETPTYNIFFERISQDTEVEENADDIMNSDQTFDFYDISLRWLYDISKKDKLRVNFINVANELVFNENINRNTFQDSKESSLKQNSIAGAIAYSRLWNETWQTHFEVYETDYSLKSINANLLDDQRFLQENNISETSIKLKTDYQVNERLQWQNGYHFVETKITNLDDVDTPRFRSLISEVVRTHGLFSQITFQSKDQNTLLKTGLRYNYIDKFSKHILEPRLSLSHQFLNYFSLEVLGEFKHQNTSQIINFQNDFLGIEKRRWQLSNDENIPVIRSRQASIGLTFNKKGWLVNTEGYYKKVKGITTQSQGFQNQYEFSRADGSYKAYGIDIIVRKQLKHFNTWLSYTYLNNDYEFDTLPEKSFPSNFDITHAFTFGINYATEPLKIALGFNYNSGKPTTRPVSGNEITDNNINYQATNSDNLTSYFRVDISALYNFNLHKNTKAELGLSIWNLLDKENVINDFYRINNNSIDNVQQSSLGLTPNATFRVKF
jgi:hypothetical protein